MRLIITTYSSLVEVKDKSKGFNFKTNSEYTSNILKPSTMYLGDNADSVFKVDCNHLYFLELGARLFKMIGREELIEEMKDNSFFAEKKNEEIPFYKLVGFVHLGGVLDYEVCENLSKDFSKYWDCRKKLDEHESDTLSVTYAKLSYIFRKAFENKNTVVISYYDDFN